MGKTWCPDEGMRETGEQGGVLEPGLVHGVDSLDRRWRRGVDKPWDSVSKANGGHIALETCVLPHVSPPWLSLPWGPGEDLWCLPSVLCSHNLTMALDVASVKGSPRLRGEAHPCPKKPQTRQGAQLGSPSMKKGMNSVSSAYTLSLQPSAGLSSGKTTPGNLSGLAQPTGRAEFPPF